MPVNVSFFRELIDSILERGRGLTSLALGGLSARAGIEELSRALLSGKGESSGVVLAQRIVEAYRSLDAEAKSRFFRFLADAFAADTAAVRAAALAFLEDPSAPNLGRLGEAVEPPRQEFFRRLNLAPGGTAAMVAMREELLELVAGHPDLKPVDADLVHLFDSWFNRGFLVLRRIDWATPANILEKIIEYEAVHEIRDWHDLKRRLDPADRRCFGFFHPSLVDEPLIFVEVALTRAIPGSIHDLIEAQDSTAGDGATTAAFYSISNCQRGLAGISFGNFLIKQVVTDLQRDMPGLAAFVTLSPAPGFRDWLERERADPASPALEPEDRMALETLDDPDWHLAPEAVEALRPRLLALAAGYFLLAKRDGGQPLDPVARFHLGNGARLERLNWLGDTSARGLKQSAGLMVTYRYDLKDIERNHEAYAEHATVAASNAVRRLLRPEVAAAS